MGRDKAVVLLGGQPLVVHTLGILRRAGLEATIAGGDAVLGEFAPVIPDGAAGQGPLSGICAALESSSAALAVFLPVDLPLLPDSAISFLLHHARVTGAPATLFSVNGFAETFPAVVARAALPALKRELEAGGRGCFSGFRAAARGLESELAILPVEMLVQAGQLFHPLRQPVGRWFLNVNTPESLRRAHWYLSPSENISVARR
jgi:molybdopterin-guanine dinucleotide biosynthesis protein A